MTRIVRNRMIRMLADPETWPRWPVLPMKRKGIAGYSVTADYPLVVLKGFPNMKGIILQLACEEGVPAIGSTELRHADEKARKLYESVVIARYDDVEALLDAGWEID